MASASQRQTGGEQASALSTLPPKVQAVIQTRLQRLSQAARSVVDLAATVGRAFTFAVLANATTQDEATLLSGLDELWRKQIIRQQEADAYDLQRDFKLANVTIDGNTATRFGEWTQVLTPKDGGDPITEVGRCVVGFAKIDGEWKVAWEIWNTYELAPQ